VSAAAILTVVLLVVALALAFTLAAWERIVKDYAIEGVDETSFRAFTLQTSDLAVTSLPTTRERAKRSRDNRSGLVQTRTVFAEAIIFMMRHDRGRLWCSQIFLDYFI
jgi:hypothetical protein